MAVNPLSGNPLGKKRGKKSKGNRPYLQARRRLRVQMFRGY